MYVYTYIYLRNWVNFGKYTIVDCLIFGFDCSINGYVPAQKANH